MRVALLTREYPPEVYGGAGVHVEYLSRELARLVDCGVYCFGDERNDQLVVEAFRPWDALPAVHGSVLRTMSVDLAMAAAVDGADVVHSHTWYTNFAGHLIKLLHGIPHVMTAHSLEPLRPWKDEQLGAGYELSKFCERTAIESADAVIAVSGAMRLDILSAYPGVAPERVHVIHNGIDPDEYRVDHGTDVLDRFGIDPDVPLVMFVGRMTRQKGIAHLLDAAQHLDEGAQLLLCAGASDTPEFGAEVRERVAQLQRERSGVVFVEQMMARHDIVQLLSHATAFVCPSVYEPFGLINLEAMACEVPVVATAIGGIPEIVLDGETGFLVPVEPVGILGAPRDEVRLARDLAARINELLRDRETARRFGRAGRQRVLEHFTWSAVAGKTALLYVALRAGQTD